MERRALPSRFLAIVLVLSVLVACAGESDTPVTRRDCTSGAAGIGDAYYPTMGNGGYDVQHYDLDLEIDVSGSEILAATTTIKALALGNLCSFNLDFEGLTIDSITVDTATADFQRRGKELTITPDQAVPAGSLFTTTVRYHGDPVRAGTTEDMGDLPVATPTVDDRDAGLGGADPGESPGLRGGWFTAEDEIFIISEPTGSRFWYPVNEHPLDKATYSTRYTVQKPFIVVANGTPEEPVNNGDTTTFGWTSRDPMASYAVTFHAGMLDVEVLEGPRGIPIRLSFAPSVPESQREVTRRMPEMLAFAESVFGPYPFESLGATITSTKHDLALETQTLPIYGALGNTKDAEVDPGDLSFFEVIMFHEMAHQWFGNSASIQRWSDIWLNEGFASYAEALWLEHVYGPAARDDELSRLYLQNRIASQLGVEDHVGHYTAQDVLDALRRLDACHSDECTTRMLAHAGVRSEAELITVPAGVLLSELEDEGISPDFFPGIPVRTGDPGRGWIFSSLSVYGRGSLTLHALRLEIGDEAFFQILQAWAARYANGNASTADFITLAEEISGHELDDFFETWLFEYGLPELDLE